MNPIIWFSIIGVSCLIVFIQQFIVNKVNRKNDTPKLEIEPFSVSAYFDRMEQAALDIQEKKEPIDKTIILWWGLDGLRLNEDGTLEWINRKKRKKCPNNDLIQYENEMEKLRELYRMESQINTPSLAMQAIMPQMQMVQNEAIIGMLSPPMMPGYIGYYPYMQPPYLQSAFMSPLTQRCCNPWYPTTWP